MTTLQLAAPQPETLPDEAEPDPPRRRWRGLWLVGAIVLLGGAAGAAYYLRQGDPLEGFELSEVKRADIEDAVTALGKIQPRDYVDVGAQVSGQLKRIAVQVGDSVQAGALLAEIDPSLALAKLELDRAQLAQQQAELAVQKLQAEFTAAEFERQKRMKGDGITRDDVFEQKRSDTRVATARLDSIAAQIRQIQSTLKADEAQLGYTRIFAPMRGTVVSLDARVGQTLIASQQTPVLLRIADLSSMTVWAQVSEADITRLAAGMDVYFTTLGHPGRKWNATLRQLLPSPQKPASVSGGPAPAAGANSVVMYTALFDVDNAAGELRPEMSAQVFFVTATAKDAVVVPVSALGVPPGGKAEPTKPAAAISGNRSAKTGTVQVANAAGELESRAVQLGVRNRFEVQVTSGLRAGERVVTSVKVEEPVEAEL